MADEPFIPVRRNGAERVFEYDGFSLRINDRTGAINLSDVNADLTIEGKKLDIYRVGKGFQHIIDASLTDSQRAAIQCIALDGKVTASELVTLESIIGNPQMHRPNACAVKR